MASATRSVRPISLGNVTIEDEFWRPFLRRNRVKTIEHQYEQLEETGTLENFRRARDAETGGFSGMWFQDSDAYKWLEAASYVLAGQEEPELRDRVEDVISLIAGAQRGDGYLNTYFDLEEPGKRWTNLHMMHELYCGGHLIEAAVAHYRATEEETLLDVACSFADHIADMFGDQLDGVPGHEGIELALVKLARATGDDRYLDLASYFVDLRGGDDRLAWELAHLDGIAGADADFASVGGSMPEIARSLWLDEDEYDGRYGQAHEPLREQAAVEGHAVRAMYLFAGAADVAMETNDEALLRALERLWENMTRRRMYVTGGIGPEAAHEGFTTDYDLPNESAYAETCAAIGSVFWNQRMFELTGEAKYAELIERTLYNAVLPGVSLDGTAFFYENPLASSGDHHRKGWFQCACCPPNLARLFASLGGYLYARDINDDRLYVSQYVGSDVSTSVRGVDVDLSVRTDLPLQGSVELVVEPNEPTAFELALRVPDWCERAMVSVNGTEYAVDDGTDYLTLDRTWDGDRVDVEFETSTVLLRAHPSVEADAGRVALKRGPLVYCAEETDNDRPLHQYELLESGSIETEYRGSLLNGVTLLTCEARAPDPSSWAGDLYARSEQTNAENASLTAVPYYAWDNRDSGRMQVWVRSGRA